MSKFFDDLVVFRYLALMHFQLFIDVLYLFVFILRSIELYLHEIGDVDLFGASGIFDVLCAVDEIFAGGMRKNGGVPLHVFHFSEYHVGGLDHFL